VVVYVEIAIGIPDAPCINGHVLLLLGSRRSEECALGFMVLKQCCSKLVRLRLITMAFTFLGK
jgi:hypothetical protein